MSLVMIRSVNSGNVRCPNKGTGTSGRENIFTCQKCSFNRGFYQLPFTVVVACSKKYPAWELQTCAVFNVNSLQHLGRLIIKLESAKNEN